MTSAAPSGRSLARLLEAEIIAWPLRADAVAPEEPSPNNSSVSRATMLRAFAFDGPVYESLMEARSVRLRRVQREDWNGAIDSALRACALEDGDEKPLWQFLERNAVRLLQPAGPAMRLEPDRDNPGNELLRWRWVSLTVPPLLLMSAASPTGSMPATRLRLLDPTLAVAGPAALLHVHQGALPQFEVLWAHLLWKLISNPSEVERRIEEPTLRKERSSMREDVRPWSRQPTAPFDLPPWMKYRWVRLLRLAALARETFGHNVPFRASGWDGLVVCSGFEVRASSRRLLDGFVHGRDIEMTSQAMVAPSIEYMIAQARRWNGHRLLGVTYDTAEGAVLDEARFIRRGLDHLVSRSMQRASNVGGEATVPASSESPPTCEQVFYQYLRIKTALYRQLVHSPWKTGLSEFNNRFARIKKYCWSTPALDRLVLDSVVDEEGIEVAAAEIRCGPSTWVRSRVSPRSPLDSDYESAWLIHFIRTTKGDQQQKLRGRFSRFGLERRNFEVDTQRVSQKLRSGSSWLQHLRGLDLAGVERDTPLWVALPFLQAVRDESVAIAARNPRLGLEPLRLTLHVGEDFDHLASGLRAVAEPCAWEIIERGDRLGHATALGLDVGQWCATNPAVRISRWERLLDLGWMQWCIGRFGIAGTDSARLSGEAEELVDAIWDERDEYALDWARRLWLDLGQATTVNRAFARTPVDVRFSNNVARRLHEYLWQADTGERADEKISVASAPDQKLMEQIRNALLEHLACWQIAIEVNPTSNLLIAGLDTPVQQPMFQIRPLEPDHRSVACIAISTDDPITFATSLADEFAYAWAGAVVGDGKSPSYVRAWLDDAAATSTRMRFTLPRRGKR